VQLDFSPVPCVDNAGELALVAETEARARDSLRAVLGDVGYAVAVVSGADELEAVLRTLVIEAPSPLVVLSVGLARRCAGALTAAAALRARAGLPEISLILTYDPGTLTTVVRPSLGPCSLVAIFEKPLDLDELRSLSRTLRLEAEASARRLGVG
jgi:hypothetical protein